jgi:pre-mRNA-splicing factor 38B
MTIGQMLKQWLTHLEWYDTLFPRIPVPIQNNIMQNLRMRYSNFEDPSANEAK